MVELEGVAFGYGRRGRLFDGLDLTLAPGNVYGLLGRNGAGKTTLLNLMSGLLFPKAGSARVAGEEVRRRRPAFLRELYFVPEEFHTPALSARALVRLYGVFYPRFDHAAMERHLAELEIDPEQRMTAMSYGQKKKVLLAFAVASQVPAAAARRADQRARHSGQEPVPPPAGRRGGRRPRDRRLDPPGAGPGAPDRSDPDPGAGVDRLSALGGGDLGGAGGARGRRRGIGERRPRHLRGARQRCRQARTPVAPWCRRSAGGRCPSRPSTSSCCSTRCAPIYRRVEAAFARVDTNERSE